MTVTMLKPILRYPGSKARLAPWIVKHFPEHIGYLEPYCGSAIVFLAKTPAKYEILNDINGDIVNLFQCIREKREQLCEAVRFTPWSREEFLATLEVQPDGLDQVERARRFMVRCWQGHGVKLGQRNGWNVHHQTSARKDTSKVWLDLPDRIAAAAQRLLQAQIDHLPALDVIRRYASPDVLIYADPPYPLELRVSGLYADEMTSNDHAELLELLDMHPGPVLLSGFHCPQYDERLRDWVCVERAAMAEAGKRTTECLWINPKAARSVQRQLEL